MYKHFPSGLKDHSEEQGTFVKLGGAPLIPLIPMIPIVMINRIDKVNDTYIKFTGGSPEQVVWHVKLLYGPVDKMELAE